MSLMAVAWALSRKARNKTQHALNGNPGGHPRVPSGVVLPRELRTLGWEVAEGVVTPCKVFDVRLRPATVAKAVEMCGAGGGAARGGRFLDSGCARREVD